MMISEKGDNSLTGGVADVLIDTVITMEKDGGRGRMMRIQHLGRFCACALIIGHYLTLAPTSFLILSLALALFSLSLSRNNTNFLSPFLLLCFALSIFLPTVHSTSHVLTQRSCPTSDVWLSMETGGALDWKK